jgi:hypothetical protein
VLYNDMLKPYFWGKAVLLIAVLSPCCAKEIFAQSLTKQSFAQSSQVESIAPLNGQITALGERVPQIQADRLVASFAPGLLAAWQQSPAAATPSGTTATLPDAPKPVLAGQKTDCGDEPCPPHATNWYQRFVNGPHARALTPREKGWLAVRNLLDPFNALTIVVEAGISVAADSHSDYGPGFPGFGKYVGVSYTEDLTGEFFNTFLIPSVMHQDPRYHRMPKASYPRRITHAITQVIWTQGDDGRGMLNYANLVGFAIDDEIGNLYVPGRETRASATAQRYLIGIATAPISNFITEFLPDVASHIHIQVVVVQRIVNQVARNDSSSF